MVAKMKKEKCFLVLLVGRVKNLTSPAKKWKLEKNAQQLYLTGTVVLYQVHSKPYNL